MKVIDAPAVMTAIQLARFECTGVHVEVAKAGSPAFSITSSEVAYPSDNNPCPSHICPAMQLMVAADVARIFPALKMAEGGKGVRFNLVLEFHAMPTLKPEPQ